MKPQLLYIKAFSSSFIKQDEELLQKDFEVITYDYQNKGGLLFFVVQLKLLVWLLQHIRKADYIFCWFADFYTLLPTFLGKIFTKKSFIVIGGYDAAKLPQFNYGGHTSNIRSWFIKKSCQYASHLLVVSDHTLTHLKKNVGNWVAEKSNIVYNTVNPHKFPLIESDRKFVTTVCGATQLNTTKVKGIPKFLELAEQFPNEQFLIIGLRGTAYEECKKKATDNVTFIGWVEPKELVNYYQQTKVICQLSEVESFGVAVAEAMSCGCTPLTFDHLGTAEVVGNTGIILNKQDNISEGLRKALALKNSPSIYRQYIIDHFQSQQRQEKLIKILKSF